MLNNNCDQRFGQTEDELAHLLQMNLTVNYPQKLYSMIQLLLEKKDLEVLAGAGNVSNVIISDVEQLVVDEPNAACPNDFQMKIFNKILPLISCIKDMAGCLMELSLISVSRKEK